MDKRGRSAGFNPPNRFERMHVEPVEDGDVSPSIKTEYFVDAARSILAQNDSPDVPFTYSINPYRGCEHGCIYCYARPTHEYLGFSSGLDFESKILVKPDAPGLLEKALRSRSWRPQPVALSGNTDCYQPVERRLELTRQCLGVFLKYRNPVSMITKSAMVLRDLDILSELAKLQLVSVQLSITTLDPELAGKMEPRASAPARRLEALRKLAAAAVPCGVSVSPVIPGLTDEEMPSILREAVACGGRSAAYILVRLPFSVEDLFIDWLGRTMPARKEKILHRLRELRSGKLSSSDFATRKSGEGKYAESLRQLFEISCRKFGLNRDLPELAIHRFLRNPDRQMSLF
jgi:DNA repair photolyase